MVHASATHPMADCRFVILPDQAACTLAGGNHWLTLSIMVRQAGLTCPCSLLVQYTRLMYLHSFRTNRRCTRFTSFWEGSYSPEISNPLIFPFNASRLSASSARCIASMTLRMSQHQSKGLHFQSSLSRSPWQVFTEQRSQHTRFEFCDMRASSRRRRQSEVAECRPADGCHLVNDMSQLHLIEASAQCTCAVDGNPCAATGNKQGPPGCTAATSKEYSSVARPQSPLPRAAFTSNL